MTNFEELIESQNFAIDTLWKEADLELSEDIKKQIRYHHANLMGVRVFLEVFNSIIER